MIIGGLQRSSLIDYPGRIAAVVFLRGCNFRCPYCFNPELVDPARYSDPIPEEELFALLNRRVGKLDGVVITGGEPTINPDLLSFIKRIKELGYLVKLDTNGSRPDLIQTAIEEDLIDYIALDLKAPFDKYHLAAGITVDIGAIRTTIELLTRSGIDHEFRTTVLPDLITESDLIAIGGIIKGARRWAIQNFQPTKVLDPSYQNRSPYTEAELERFKEKLKGYVLEIEIR